MALRVPRAELATGLSESMIEQFGAVPEPVEVVSHNPKVAEFALELGGKVSAWDAVDESLKSFAHMAVAAQVGCSWCLDLGYFQAQNQNLDMAKASQVPRWRESERFTPLERDVLEYAEAMTTTPPSVTDRAVGASARPARPGWDDRAHGVRRVLELLDQEQRRARGRVAGLLVRVRDSAGRTSGGRGIASTE